MNSLLLDLVVVVGIACVVAGLIMGLYLLVQFVVKGGKTGGGADTSNHVDE